MLELPGWAPLKAPKESDKWKAVKAKTAEAMPGLDTPEAVHLWARRNITYTPERIDLWQSPAHTLKRKAGDCEDIAILERALLKAAGWDKPMWLLIVYDIIVRTDHALLITDGKMLDCRTDRIIPLELFSDYRPIAAYSDEAPLTFGRRRG